MATEPVVKGRKASPAGEVEKGLLDSDEQWIPTFILLDEDGEVVKTVDTKVFNSMIGELREINNNLMYIRGILNTAFDLGI